MQEPYIIIQDLVVLIGAVVFNAFATYTIYMAIFRLDKLRSFADKSLEDSISPVKSMSEEIVSSDFYGCYLIILATVGWIMSFSVMILFGTLLVRQALGF